MMKWLLGLGLLGLFANICAQPLICPPRSWIIATGISPYLSQNIVSGLWYGGFLSQNAGTMDKWTFVVGGIVATGSTQAYNMINATLPTIQLVSGPIHVNLNQWICVYSNAAGYGSVAYNPPLGCESCANPA
jgi:hypothetical protein